MSEINISREGMSLPAWEIADEVSAKLRESANLVITAPPGAGKSTLLPLTILRDVCDDGKILMLEPRRVAARQIAERMSALVGEDVGRTVGYRVRFESRTSEATRIEVLTEGILTRRIVGDPTLEGVSVVIFDEFHERSLNADVAMALVREVQSVVRPDLHIVVMSATIDASGISSHLSAPVVESRGRMFPVDIRYVGECDAYSAAEMVAEVVREAHRNEEGDILAFLPGEGEIRKTEELLAGKLGSTRVYPLYGMLPQREQRRAIAASVAGERKVVLATSIAETSLTIEGVRIVVDSGLCRMQRFDARSGLSRLETVRITQDMAEQRAGRAGRLSAGTCYRLWTLATQQRMKERRDPEIVYADLAPVALDVATWGERDMMRLPWLTLPPRHGVAMAHELLMMLDAVSADGSITEHGCELAALPCHPRIAQMLMASESQKMRAAATDVAAIIEERDLLSKTEGADINIRMVALRRYRSTGVGLRGWERVERVASQYRQLLSRTRGGVDVDNEMPDSFDTGMLVASAYPERIASARAGNGSIYMLSGGQVASLPQADELSGEEWIAVANMDARDGIGKIFLASPLDPSDLRGMVREFDNVGWDMKRGMVVAQHEMRIGRIVLSSRPKSDLTVEQVVDVMVDAARKDGERMFSFADDAVQLQRRVATVAQWRPELELPDVSVAAVIGSAAEWLPMYIGRSRTVDELRKINMCDVVWQRLTYEQQQAVELFAPKRMVVPTGSNVRLDYREVGTPPVLKVRLQEVFGMTDTPRVDGGRRGVVMELLSPGFKPVQVTSDLRSFWSNAYVEVRKELRRRYPKHSWPDDPLSADPVRGVVRRKQ